MSRSETEYLRHIQDEARYLAEASQEVIPNAEDHYTDWTVTDGRIAVAKKFHLSCTTS
ncbi:hypothetical protein GGP54_003403, partial [Salinibacter ruber]|nr:hypothetical protein [Salinibacter ruber]MCS4038320.1 hypothetical protein [Salinibacter ruber]